MTKKLFVILFLLIACSKESSKETPYFKVTSVTLNPMDKKWIWVENSRSANRIVPTTEGVVLYPGVIGANIGHYLPGVHIVNIKLYDGNDLKNEQNIELKVLKRPIGDFMGIYFKDTSDYSSVFVNDTMTLRLDRHWTYEPYMHYAGITCGVTAKFKDTFDATVFLSRYMTSFYGSSEYIDDNQSGTLHEIYNKIFIHKLIELNEMPVEIWKAPKCDIALIKTTRNTSYIIAQKKPW